MALPFMASANNHPIQFDVEIQMELATNTDQEFQKRLHQMIQETILSNKNFRLKSPKDTSELYEVKIEILQFVAEQNQQDANTGFSGHLILNLNILDQEKSVVLSKNFSYNNLSKQAEKLSKLTQSFGLLNTDKVTNTSNKLSSKTSTDLINNFLKSFKTDLNICLNELFPTSLPVVEVLKVKNGEALNVLILKEQGQFLKKGTEFELFKVTKKEYNGKTFTRKEPFGKIKVLTEEGDFVRCKVLKGKKEMKKCMDNTVTVLAQKTVRKKLKNRINLTK